MKYFYDTEFLDNGTTIDLISIGIVAEDGREYYAVNSEADYQSVRCSDWLMKNVVPALPGTNPVPPAPARGPGRPSAFWKWALDTTNSVVKPKQVIANEVRDFLLAGDDRPELWAYCAAYDHVALAQLWGPMIKLPKGIPMMTNDIMQLHEAEAGIDDHLPEQFSGLHNALADARHVKVMYDYINDGYQS